MDRRVDRIAQPWGTRTPYGPGQDWPVRADMYLEEGARPDQVTWVETASILHSNGDALEIAVRDGRMVGVRGVGRSRVNRGRWARRIFTAGRPTDRRTGSPGRWSGATARWSRSPGTRR